MTNGIKCLGKINEYTVNNRRTINGAKQVISKAKQLSLARVIFSETMLVLAKKGIAFEKLD